jgi:hypothetical protein
MSTHTEEMTPIPIRLSEEDRAMIRGADEFTPVFSSWQNITFTGIAADTGQPQPLIQANLKRRRAYFQVRQTLGTPAQNEGSVTTPGANVAIVTIATTAMAPGWYTVNWAVDLDGTPGAGDVNNFILKGPGLGSGVTADNNGAVGHWQQDPVLMYVPAGNATALSVRSILAGTAGAIYTAQVTLSPVQGPTGYVLVGTYGQVSNGQGGRVYTTDPRWEIRGHGLLYIVGDGVTAMNITVLEELDQGE